MSEVTVPVPPYRHCAFSDDDVLPFRGLSHSGSQSNGHETPVQRLACHGAFPVKNTQTQWLLVKMVEPSLLNLFIFRSDFK
jgi:hypothetical protein